MLKNLMCALAGAVVAACLLVGGAAIAQAPPTQPPCEAAGVCSRLDQIVAQLARLPTTTAPARRGAFLLEAVNNAPIMNELAGRCLNSGSCTDAGQFVCRSIGGYTGSYVQATFVRTSGGTGGSIQHHYPARVICYDR